MREVIYKGYKIISNPLELADDPEYSYTIYGYIKHNFLSGVQHIPDIHFNIPESEWRHKTEESADTVLITYAKIFIDNSM